MSEWDDVETKTAEEATEFWRTKCLDDMLITLNAPVKVRQGALRVATRIITKPGSVWEPGCGDGIVGTVLPEGCTYYGTEISPSVVAGAQEVHRNRIADGSTVIEEGDFFEELKVLRNFDWTIVVNLFGMFPEQTLFDVLSDLWRKTTWGLSLTTFNKNTYKYTRRLGKTNKFQSHDPHEVREALLALPGAGEFRMEEMVKRYSSRKMCAYLYRDTYPGVPAESVK